MSPQLFTLPRKTMTNTFSTSPFAIDMSSFEASWKQRDENNKKALAEALNTHQHLFADGSFTANVVWYGGGDSGEFSETNLYKNGEAFSDASLEKIVEDLTNKYLDVFHAGCEINEGSAGTISINKDGTSDNLEYYEDTHGEEEVCPITNQEVLNILSRIDVASIDNKDEVITYSYGWVQTENDEQVSEELINELKEVDDSGLEDFGASGENGDMENETINIAFRDNKWVYTCCFVEKVTESKGTSISFEEVK